MTFNGRKHTLLLFGGDIAIFLVALWLTLLLRYQNIPTTEILADHLPSFLFLFGIWSLVFYMAGLYGKHIILYKNKISTIILRVQFINIIIAGLFFFLVPGIGIAPKTNLILYLFVSLALIFSWRFWLFPKLTKPKCREPVAVIGTGSEVAELVAEVNSNPRYGVHFVHVVDATQAGAHFEEFVSTIKQKNVSLVVVDSQNDSLRALHIRLYKFATEDRSFEFGDIRELYEEVFDRVPLSLLQYDWYMRNSTNQMLLFYASGKRVVDIVGGVIMGMITVCLIPFVWLALRLEGPGSLFIAQKRIGLHGSSMRAFKFRSMRYNDSASSAWVAEGGVNYVTRVGAFLRLTSLDEFPQFVNILSGELSLVGPRNDTEGLGRRLADEIPYYNLRYSVKPGITGWAQINQQYEQGNISPQSVEETKTRLAYDFYYIQNRSLFLDIVIALKTVKRMFFRVSSW